MKTFKVYWTCGMTELLRGRDIADAFNAAGYSTEEHRDSMKKYIPVIHPEVEALEVAVFSCFHCKGYPDTKREEGNVFSIYCPDCNQNTRSKILYPNEESARLDWNKKQLRMSGTPIDIDK